MSYTSLLGAFLAGVLLNAMWGYMLRLGYTIIFVKTAMRDALLLLAKNIQSVYDINAIKYQAWVMTGKDEKYVDYQRMVDEKELLSFKNMAIRNFINSVPPKYNHLVEFHDWDSAMQYIEKFILEDK